MLLPALFMLSALTSVLISIETLPVGTTLCAMVLCALFACAGASGALSVSVLASLCTVIPSIAVGLLVKSYEAMIASVFIMLAGFFIALMHRKGAFRFAVVSVAALIFAVLVCLVFVLRISEMYGAFTFENLSAFFDSIEKAIADAFVELTDSLTLTENIADMPKIDSETIRAVLFQLRITSFVGGMLSLCFTVAYLTTAIYRFISRKGFGETDFPLNWRMYSYMSTRVFYILFLIVGLFTVGSYTSYADIKGFFSVLCIALFNLSDLFGTILLIEGIFALKDFLVRVKEKTKKNAFAIAFFVGIALLLIYPQAISLVLIYFGFSNPRIVISINKNLE